MIKKIIISGLIGLSAVSFVACSDDGGDSSGGGVKSGTFSDSEVEGLSYSTPSQKGYTDANGTFKYNDGEEVTFKIGGITLGKSKAQSDMTPVTLVGTNYNDPKVVKILQFLQSIDSDNNASNGITISDAFRADAERESIDFTTDVDLKVLYTGLKVKKEHQVSKDDALSHFKKTLDKIHKPANAKEFSIIKGVYQDGTTIIDITSSGIVNSYKYDELDSCIKAVTSTDKTYSINGKSLTHNTNKKRFKIDGTNFGWSYENNKIRGTFVEKYGDTMPLISNKSTKFTTSSDIEQNMCTFSKRFEKIKGIYQYTTTSDEDENIINTVTNIDQNGTIKSYKYNDSLKCLKETVSGDYNFVLNNKVLSKEIQKDDDFYYIKKEYFVEDDQRNRFCWIEKISAKNTTEFYVEFRAYGENGTIAGAHYRLADSTLKYVLTAKKSIKFRTPIDITNNMCDTNKYKNIQGVYQYVKIAEDTTDANEKKMRNAVIHINKDGKIKSYIHDSGHDCLKATVSGDYNFILDDKSLSKLSYPARSGYAQYYYIDPDENRFVWLENQDSNIEMVGYKGKDDEDIKESKLVALSLDNYVITPFKSTKYTEANIAGSMCTN